MQYIELNNSSFILHTRKGSTHVSRSSFNFNKIKAMIKEGTGEEFLLPLLEPPELPNGIYEAYESIKLNKMYYSHKTDKNGVFEEYICVLGQDPSTQQFLINSDDYVFVGKYASLKELYYDWPEYLV